MTYQHRVIKIKFNWLSIFLLLFASIIFQFQITSNVVASEISELSDSLICRLGVVEINGKKKWASENYGEKYRIEASSRGIDCLSNHEKSTKHNITSKAQTLSKEVVGLKSYDLGKAFKVQSFTKRKQVQYALKKLGFYSKNVDGLWGSGTKKAIESYAVSNNLSYERPETIFRDITKYVKVPNSFASTKSTKSNKKPKSSGESNFLKLLILGGLCATTPDPSACLAGAASSATGSRKPDYSSIGEEQNPNTSSFGGGVSSNTYESSCSSDFSCGLGEKCIKRPGSSSGICMKSVNEYGIQNNDLPNVNSGGLRNFDDKDCNFSTDCPIGFTCDMTYKVCVKR